MLKTIPENVFVHTPSLVHLAVNHNALKRLPESLETLGHLELLDLNNNDLSTLKKEHFAQMMSLRILKLNFNSIVHLPKDFLNQNANIEEIYLEGNRIETIQYGAFLNLLTLRILDLSRNKIQNISLVTNNLPSLAYLFLNDNNLTRIDRWRFSPATQVLFLQNNRIRFIEPGTFKQLSQLQLVHLEHNSLRTISPYALQLSQHLVYRPQFYLAGNVVGCDCHMEWILKVCCQFVNSLLRNSCLHLQEECISVWKRMALFYSRCFSPFIGVCIDLHCFFACRSTTTATPRHTSQTYTF